MLPPIPVKFVKVYPAHDASVPNSESFSRLYPVIRQIQSETNSIFANTFYVRNSNGHLANPRRFTKSFKVFSSLFYALKASG